MSKSAKDDTATQTHSDIAKQPVQDIAFGPLRLFGTVWADAIVAMNSEVANFVADRIQEDVRTQHQLLHCRGQNELIEIQKAYLERAFAQYAAETGKLIEIGVDTMPNFPTKTHGTPV